MQTERALFDPERHEPLTEAAWDEDRARLEVARIVSDVADARGEGGFWPDDDDLAGSIYSGATGIIWTAEQLAVRGYDIDLQCFQRPDLSEQASVWKNYHAMFKGYDMRVSHSYIMGPVGALMLVWKDTRDPEILDRLDVLIAENQDHPWMENLWGAPSTMLAASHLFEATGEERFANHIRSGAAYMWDKLEDAVERECRVWDILLYGRSMKLTGAGHGFIGNVFSIVRNPSLFDAQTRQKWTDLIVETMTATSISRGGLVNWLPALDLDPTIKDRDKVLLHQCHGAPGVVIGLSGLYGQAGKGLDDLMVGAGELIWQAGPLKKYPCLCHGTAGNAYVFLKLWKATGDDKWLTRARAFAMAAVEQRAKRARSGEPLQNSLWEGDMGIAICLADCIEGKSVFPILDYF